MDVKKYSRMRVSAVLDLIFRLKDIDFPYRHSKDALERLESIFVELEQNLDYPGSGTDSELVENACKTSLYYSFLFLPVIGFVLRSTNVRNAFEVHGPLLRMSRKLLGNETKLLLSSEWEYSPYTYWPLPLMEEYVLIGLPTTESSNPLVLTLAGHELGHSLWKRHKLVNEMTQPIQKAILEIVTTKQWVQYRQLFPGGSDNRASFPSMFDRAFLAPSEAWCLRQAEESFCDFVGLRLFGLGYLHGFVYLLAPGTGGRAPYYPSLVTRFKNLAAAASDYNIQVPDGFQSVISVSEEVHDWNERMRFLVEVADLALSLYDKKLIDLAAREVATTDIELPDIAVSDGIVKMRFGRAVPAEGKKGLANVLNAGWLAFLDENCLANFPNIKDRERCLREIILKSVEIIEVEDRLGEGK